MKKRDKQQASITEGYRKLIKLVKRTSFGMLLLSLILIPFSGAIADSVYQKQLELNQLQNSIDGYQAKLDQTQSEIDTLKNQLANLDNSIAKANLEIKKTDLEIDKVNLEINDTKDRIAKKNRKLKEQKDILGQAIKYMYEEGETPFVETLFSSDTFSQILDKTEYLNTAEMKVEKTMGEIEAIKAELVTEKNGLKKDRNRLVKLRQEHQERVTALNSQRAVRNNMIALTRGKESIYQSKLSSLTARRLAISSWLKEQIYRGGTGGYPYQQGPPCPSSTDGHSYYAGQCVSYVYWKRASVGNPVGEQWGSAWRWKGMAEAAGYSVDQNPRPGDVMWFSSAGGDGHVAYVETVSGASITISEYNYGYDCQYNRRTINIYNYGGAYFIH